MKKHIVVLAGDGIGPEITDAAVDALKKVADLFNHEFEFENCLMGACAIHATGEPLPQETIDKCLASDSVLLGAVGVKVDDPFINSLPGHKRPEAGLLGIRKAMGLYSNIRPARLFPALSHASPLRRDIAEKGMDIVIVRELIGGIYFGKRGGGVDAEYGEYAWDTEQYSVKEVTRIAKIAFEMAKGRRKKVTSIDKANVLDSSRLWRKTVHEVAKDYPDVELVDMLVDNAAQQLVKDPSQFDVIVTSNIFGDILSDEAAMITGSIGMLSSSSLGDTKCGLYEPIHGSAPDIAGMDIANPIATVLAGAMMLRDSFGMDEEAKAIERAVDKVLDMGYRTPDIMSEGMKKIKGSEMRRLIVENIERA
ncbi:MAG: 3-isopropylmalate dehydrogenase [Clostridia bacterium]|nr:3-isopropylmalate dehydrogenase [Clostridia bacterium]